MGGHRVADVTLCFCFVFSSSAIDVGGKAKKRAGEEEGGRRNREEENGLRTSG